MHSLITWFARNHVASNLLMVLLLATVFSHLWLGLQVVIEDYVHSREKAPVRLAVRFGCAALAAAGILATLRITAGQRRRAGPCSAAKWCPRQASG